MYYAYNMTTGEIIECESRRALNRIVKRTIAIDRKYGPSLARWVFSPRHDPRPWKV